MPRIRPATVIVPLALACLIALATLSYLWTRSDITPGPMFAAPGTGRGANAFVVPWRTGTDIAIIVSFTTSRRTHVRSVTMTGLDPREAFIVSSEYGLWDGQTPLPVFTSETDPLPSAMHPRTIIGSFLVPAHGQVFVRLVVRATANANVTDVLTGLRVDAESWAWAHTTFIPFEQPVKLQPPP